MLNAHVFLPNYSVRAQSHSHLSITARHSFLQVKRLPLRKRKLPVAELIGGGVWRHSISSRVMGAGRMFRVAPGKGNRIIIKTRNKNKMSEVISSEQHFLISLYKNTVRTRLASILNIINGLFRQRDCSFYIIKMEIMITSLVYCHCVYPHLFYFFFINTKTPPLRLLK